MKVAGDTLIDKVRSFMDMTSRHRTDAQRMTRAFCNRLGHQTCRIITIDKKETLTCMCGEVMTNDIDDVKKFKAQKVTDAILNKNEGS